MATTYFTPAAPWLKSRSYLATMVFFNCRMTARCPGCHCFFAETENVGNGRFDKFEGNRLILGV